MRSRLAILIILTALSLAACAGTTGGSAPGSERLEFIEVPAELQHGLPALPDDRAASITLDASQIGVIYQVKSSNAIENDTRLDPAERQQQYLLGLLAFHAPGAGYNGA